MSLHSYFLALAFFIHIFIIFHPCYLILASLYSPIPVITLSYSGHVSILSFSLHSLILSLYYLNTLFIHYSCPFIYLYPTIYFLIPVLTLSHPYPYILLSTYYSHRYILISPVFNYHISVLTIHSDILSSGLIYCFLTLLMK